MVKAALEGMHRENVLTKKQLLNGVFYHLEDRGRAKQAAEGTSAAEVAALALRDSTVMGDPREGDPNPEVDRFFRDILG